MKYRLFTIILLASLTLCAQAKGRKELLILHSNDTHSCIFPLNKNLADTMLAGRGGYLRRVNFIKEERARNPKLVLLDSGDFSQGSGYYTIFKGDVEVGLMNLMGYEAATIGNHEFDFGLENMARIFKMCNFPIVCANYDFTGTCLEDVVKPYTVLKHDGVKIGVFGLSPELDGLVSIEKCKGVKFLNPIEAARKVVSTLRNDLKCDIVICLSHLGWNQIDAIGDEQLIQGTDGIDLVLGGHSHTYMKQMEWVKNDQGKLIPDDQNGKHGLWIGKITLELEKK